ncbi:MAG: helix-turn-helix domain-containing protein [Phycisphaerae bacterium]
MAKTFYTSAEAAKKLGKSEDDLRAMARDGKIREFRDAGSVNYKVDEIDQLAATTPSPPPGSAAASASGEIVLEPVEDSGITLAPGGSDVLNLEEVDPSDETATGSGINKARKEGSVVPSVGVNVFDDDELDEVVDPLAQTAVTDVAGLGIDGAGSGSGIMNLSRESDDTSLGAELLDEIYSGDDSGAVEMGEATRAGLEEAIVEPEEEDAGKAEDVFSADVDEDDSAPTTAATPRAVEVVRTVPYAPDALSASLTAAMVVAVVVMWVAGLAAAAMVRGITPGIIDVLYHNLMVFSGGCLGVGIVTAGVVFLLKRRSS